MFNGKIKKCKHLIKTKTGKTLCRVYNKRLGIIIDKDANGMIGCVYRDNSKYDYKDCPYNKGKEILEVGY